MQCSTAAPAAAAHCESGEGLWPQGEAALQTHSFRDAEPHPVIPQIAKKAHGVSQAAQTRYKYQPDHHEHLSTYHCMAMQ